MDNMPFKLVDDFYYTELSEFDRLVLPYLSGVQRPLYELRREETIREFCRRTDALMGLHSTIRFFTGQLDYDLIAVPGTLEILQLRDVRISETGRSLNPKAYRISVDRALLTLQSGWDASLDTVEVLPLISLTMARGAERVESDFFSRWGDGIAAGIVRDLMLMPKKQWSDPQMAGVFAVQYESAVVNAKIAVSRMFSQFAGTTITRRFE